MGSRHSQEIPHDASIAWRREFNQIRAIEWEYGSQRCKRISKFCGVNSNRMLRRIFRAFNSAPNQPANSVPKSLFYKAGAMRSCACAQSVDRSEVSEKYAENPKG